MGLLDIIGDVFGTDQPDPNWGIHESADNAMQLGREQLQLQREQFAWAKDLGAEQLALTQRTSKEQLGLAKKVTDEQLGIMKENRSRATEQWNEYKKTFQPIERQMAKDATEYDSPWRMEQQAAMAGQDAAAAHDAAGASLDRELARYGGPASHAGSSAKLQAGLARAKDTAGAMTRARVETQDRAIGLRAGAASFGRGMPNTAAQAYGLSTQAGNSVVGNSNATGNSVVGNSNQTATSVVNNTGNPTQWSQLSAGTNASAGQLYGLYSAQNLGARQFETGLNYTIHRDEADRAANFFGGFAGGMMSSDENVKTDKEAVDAELVLDGIKRIPVEAWKYKSGVADEGRHIGPYAQDVNAQFGDQVAPGGTHIDPISMHGIALVGLKELAKKVERLEKAGGGASYGLQRKKLSTEPARKAA